MEKLNNNETILKLSIYDSIEVKPDKAIINININSEKENETFSDNKKALSVGESTVEKALKIIKSFNIKDDAIDTGRLNINAKFEYTEKCKQTNGLFGKELEKTSKSVIAGYNFKCLISVKLDSDDERIVKLYCSLVNNKYMRDIRVDFITENTDTYYDKLLEKIIDKARHQAHIIAKASYKSVENISNISVGARSYDVNYASFSNCVVYDDCECISDDSFEDSVNTHIEAMANTTKFMGETISFEYKLK